MEPTRPSHHVGIRGGIPAQLSNAEPNRMVSGKNLLPLRENHVILGRYNRSKTKPLTRAVDMYKEVRSSQGKRSKNHSFSKISSIKQGTALLLQEELAYARLPQVTFWVCLHKARGAGKLDELEKAHPEFRTCVDFDGQEAVFVRDHNDYFLKADLEQFKQRRKTPEAPVLKSEEVEREKSLGDTLKRTASGGVRYSTESSCATTVYSSSTASRSISISESSASTRGAGVYFQLTAGSALPLETQVDHLCWFWIGEGPDPEAVRRKTLLVDTLKAQMIFYENILCGNDPFRDSQVTALRQMNEAMLVQVVNTLGNSMVKWFEQHPSTCLPGEVDEWIAETRGKSQDSDYSGVEKGSVGTFAASDDNLSDAPMRDIQCLSDTQMSDDEIPQAVSDCFRDFSISHLRPYESPRVAGRASKARKSEWRRRRSEKFVKQVDTVVCAEEYTIARVKNEDAVVDAEDHAPLDKLCESYKLTW